MGLFDEAKKMVTGKGGSQDSAPQDSAPQDSGGQDDNQDDGQGNENQTVKNAADKGEQFVNDKTGNKYQSQVEKGVGVVEDQVQKRMPNQ
jgi:hypothetical protein